jgi:predicted lipoprotein
MSQQPATHVGFLLTTALLVSAALWPGCHVDSGQQPSQQTTRDELVTSILHHTGPQVVEPALRVFTEEAQQLQAVIDTWHTTRDDASLTTAQEQWQSTMLAWQYLELMKFGPTGSESIFQGGEDLGDEIYSWPTVSACRIDAEVVEASWKNGTFFDENFVNTYGLDALEYLLFSSQPENSCSPLAPINEDGTWDALEYEAIQDARADLAAVLVAYLVEVSDTLYVRWLDDFSMSLAELTDPEDQAAILDEMFYALTDLHAKTLDLRLCFPLELNACEQYQPAIYEHSYSGIGLQAVHSNLTGFRDLFTGGSGPGFDDLLVWHGQVSMMETFLIEIDRATELASELADVESIQPGDERVIALHDAIEYVTELYEGGVKIVLMLKIPRSAQGEGETD